MSADRLPKKGKLLTQNKEVENSEEFKQARRKHTAIESSIGALGNHGLDRCSDNGIDGFKRYARLGNIIQRPLIIGHAIKFLAVILDMINEPIYCFEDKFN